MRPLQTVLAVSLVLGSSSLLGQPLDKTQLAVWANEAIVATYSYDYKNYLQRQREIAKYFSADAWIAYSRALNESKLPEAVQKNAYTVQAVATLPPEIKSVGDKKWQATMPILVIYKNPQYQQKQSLDVTLNFGEAPKGQGVRGLSISSLQARVSVPPCECTAKASEESQSPNASPAETTPAQ